ncbi:Crp/Fnr family transcriptional regulator [Streptomyces platensis]|uniref:Crp/Fnr family transcriptional regulator n=1 Tax=Streptomyces platensis TaxID=58346 RepID=UPI002E148C24|nr:Crp/Fnr family transcriptional regulator [Streptomyces platensis]WUB80790.1 Crp/Fnr family transcriptional regulator [Streptomyces platensis]
MDVERCWEKVFGPGRSLTYRKGQPMILKGSPRGSVLRVVEGWALVTDPHPDGSRTFLELRGRGQLLGETSVLSGGRRNADVTAVCRTTVRVVDGDRFIAELRRNDVLVGMLLRAQEMHRTANMRAGLRSFGVVNGLSRLLLDLAGTAGEPLVAGIPQKVLAYALGVTPRTLYEAVAELERRGALSTRWPVIGITDEAVLRQLAHSDE